MRWAARPVGAASVTRTFFARRIAHNARRIVVFPVPGPPVTIENFSDSAVFTAAACSGANANPALRCAQATAFSTRTGGRRSGVPARAETHAAISRSAAAKSFFCRSGTNSRETLPSAPRENCAPSARTSRPFSSIFRTSAPGTPGSTPSSSAAFSSKSRCGNAVCPSASASCIA